MLTQLSLINISSFVVGFDIDEDAIADFRDNLEENFAPESAASIDLVLCDVTQLTPPKTKFFDTVILNPPFGTNDKNNGIDVQFLKKALCMAKEHVYSLHKTTTRKVRSFFAQTYFYLLVYHKDCPRIRCQL